MEEMQWGGDVIMFTPPAPPPQLRVIADLGAFWTSTVLADLACSFRTEAQRRLDSTGVHRDSLQRR